eukprot:TRINITY_DN8909_c0_g1_i3.p1 TRINITY_DN8909_c0_g1~~TRINITY_DN8909_c0_g1_i3.p1  ORF type:complete len:199 (+),score=39.55 TRINITY_DN8909_c0_g1_i3:35-631(+)
MFSALPSCCSSSLEEEVQVIGEDDRANPVPASEQENLGWKMQLGRAALANAATCGKNIAALADAATCGSSPCSACPCRAEVIDSTSAARSKPCKPFKEVISKVQGKWRSMPDGTAVGDIRGEEIHWDEFHYGGARIPQWSEAKLAFKGKYLGAMLGPESGASFFEEAMQKWRLRGLQIGAAGTSAFISAHAYNTHTCC